MAADCGSPTPWFFAPSDGWEAERILLPQDETKHARRVLRLEDGDSICVTDGAGRVAACVLAGDVSARAVAGIRDLRTKPRPTPELVVYQAAAKGHKVEDVIDRMTQLGASEIRVFESARSVARYGREKRRKLAVRNEAVARAAAKQSRNPFIPSTSAPISFAQLTSAVRDEPVALVLWEGASVPLHESLPEDAARIALITGPEGGLEDREVEALEEAGATPVSLGGRILRTELASVVAASAVLFRYGCIG
jgi:16S rRNA (uracil1498-N3)-methyltransferase